MQVLQLFGSELFHSFTLYTHSAVAAWLLLLFVRSSWPPRLCAVVFHSLSSTIVCFTHSLVHPRTAQLHLPPPNCHTKLQSLFSSALCQAHCRTCPPHQPHSQPVDLNWTSKRFQLSLPFSQYAVAQHNCALISAG